MLFEKAREVGLICQPATERNLRQRILGREHQVACSINAPPQNIAMRWFAEALLERAGEVARAQLRNAREIPQ
jgi:hypothetical protein